MIPVTSTPVIKNQLTISCRRIQIACRYAITAVATYRDGVPDHAFLIGVQDVNDDGIPEPYEGVGKGKALTAGNAAGTGYITVAYNNDASLGGLPVSLQVIQVGCTKNHLGEDSTYRGNLLVINSDNLFDEKLTLRHTGDLVVDLMISISSGTSLRLMTLEFRPQPYHPIIPGTMDKSGARG